MWSWLRWWVSPVAVSLGERGEQAAEAYLRHLGYQIVDRRHRNRAGEIDLVALDGQTVVFVEVKSRRDTSHGHPTDALSRDKQQRLTRAALVYLKQRGWLERQRRFDVVAIVWPPQSPEPQITHYRQAFEAAQPGQLH